MPPNVLLITADQWRGDCLGAAGHPIVRTPNVDRLAADGAIFLRHYAQAAPCSPSRASLYTGLYQMNHRVVRNGTPLDARHDNIALAMRRAGYRPTLFGYTDQSVDPRTVPADSPLLKTYEGILPGFDVAVQLPENPAAWLAWLETRGIAPPENFWEIYEPIGGPSPRPSNAPPRYGADETETAFLTGAFLDWLAGRQGEAWFAHVSYLRPHPPYVAPEPFNTMYDPASGPGFRRGATPEAEAAQHPFLAYIFAQNNPGWTDADYRTVRAVYWGMVSEVDRQIGRLLDGLRASAADETIVILTSDHGEMLGDHWSHGKFGYFDQAFHVPLIIRDPRRAGGTRIDAFTESIDLMPTILDLVDAEIPAHLDGRSLAPFLAGHRPAGWREAVHWEYDFREPVTGAAEAALGLDLDSCALAVHRDERFKYVHFAGLRPLLFDLAADPDELTDRADDPAYAPVRLACAEKLLAWRARHLDRTLTGMALTPTGLVDARK